MLVVMREKKKKYDLISIFTWLYFVTIVLTIDDILWWSRKLKMEKGDIFSRCFSPNTKCSHFHVALLGNNGDWQRRNEVRWRSCHRQRKKEKPSCQRPQKNNTKYVREKFRIVYLPSLSSLMNEFLVARLCSAHLFIKIEKCVNAIHHSI